jgi:hypothetical protein
MAILGGSPLGLIGVASRPVRATGMSTFNADNSRNINVDKYNVGKDKYPITEFGTVDGENVTKPVEYGTRSLFTGQSVIAPYANIGPNKGGADKEYKGISRNYLHSNDIYDTSLLNIIEQLANSEAALRPADFAYLKDVGVYPNNRLVIARRFLDPHDDNIFGKSNGKKPMAVMISWKPQTEDFLEINFGEKWIDAKADFTQVLNSLGEDFMGKNVGGKVGAALNIIPLPGFTENIQRYVLKKMKILDEDGTEALPSGNPNLIKMAKRRKTVGYSDADSGLECKVSIKMVCEWEQKFISGIDPTIAWQDIIAMVLRFGTSRSDTYGLNKDFEAQMKTWINTPGQIVEDMIKWVSAGITSARDAMVSAASSVLNRAALPGDVLSVPITGAEKTAALIKAKQAVSNAGDALVNLVNSGLSKQLKKYRIELEGIARSLSGAASTPWHVTIGNPMRPVFCAGDMLVEDVKLTLGSALAFNDLPTTIRAEFVLTNARPWGLQEILAKFNAGSIRTLITIKDGNTRNINEKSVDNPLEGTENTKASEGIPTVQTAAQSSLSSQQSAQDLINQKLAISVPSNTFLDNFGDARALPLSSISSLKASGLTTTKEGKSGEQIITDVYMYKPTSNSFTRRA